MTCFNPHIITYYNQISTYKPSFFGPNQHETTQKKILLRFPKNTTPYLEIPGFIPENRENPYQNLTVDHNFHTNCHKLGQLPRFSDKPELLHKPQSASTKCLTTSNPTMASGSKDVGIGQVTGCPKFIHIRSIINFPPQICW